eukprot:UC4_evm2s1268
MCDELIRLRAVIWLTKHLESRNDVNTDLLYRVKVDPSEQNKLKALKTKILAVSSLYEHAAGPSDSDLVDTINCQVTDLADAAFSSSPSIISHCILWLLSTNNDHGFDKIVSAEVNNELVAKIFHVSNMGARYELKNSTQGEKQNLIRNLADALMLLNPISTLLLKCASLHLLRLSLACEDVALAFDHLLPLFASVCSCTRKCLEVIISLPELWNIVEIETGEVVFNEISLPEAYIAPIPDKSSKNEIEDDAISPTFMTLKKRRSLRKTSGSSILPCGNHNVEISNKSILTRDRTNPTVDNDSLQESVSFGFEENDDLDSTLYNSLGNYDAWAHSGNPAKEMYCLEPKKQGCSEENFDFNERKKVSDERKVGPTFPWQPKIPSRTVYGVVSSREGDNIIYKEDDEDVEFGF